MNTLRIFISSPSDVREERTVAGRVIERLQGKYWSFVRLDDVFWESRVARATAHFQDELLNPGQCDMVLGILWTRLGSPLPEKFRKLTGEAHATGTEWELSQAFEAYDASLAQTGDPLIAKPDVIVYRRTEERDCDPSDGEGRRQREALNDFLDREFFNQDAHHTIKRALTFYATLDEFETRLAGDLEQLILRRIPTLKPGFEPPPISGPPFKGLSHFDFEDSDRFFGRNRAIREVQQRLIERAAEGMPFVLIYGGSGYGKSSLMRAGLSPVLTRPGGAASGMDRWRRVLVQPGKGTGPLCERLARALLAPPAPHEIEQQKLHERWPLPGLPELSQTTIEPDDTGECWDAASLARLLADETKLIYAAAGVARTLDRIGCSLLLQIDQLEELFTSESVTAAEHDAFFSAVAALTRTRRVWTVATMRSEYFPRIAETPTLAALVSNNGGYILAPPTQQELREIIRFPALAARLDYERATSPREIAGALTTAEHLDEQILADAADSPDALPLIEFTLHKLHAALLAPDGHRTGDLLCWDTYAALGGLKGSIARTAEETFSTLAPHVQGACDTLFANLVRVDAGSRDVVTRKRPSLATLRAAAPGAGDFLDAFLAAHLLVTDEEAGHAIVTLAHEALITHWPRLTEWIAHHRAILRSRQRLEENARLWIESGRSKKLLLAEGRLAEAREVVESRLFQIPPEEADLVGASRGQAKKRTRILQTALLVFASLGAVATWQWRIAENNRRSAEINQRLAESNQQRAEEKVRESSRSDFNVGQGRLRQGKWSEALAYFARALQNDPGNRSAEDALLMSLLYASRDEGLLPLAEFPADRFLTEYQFSPDGKRILSVSYGGRLGHPSQPIGSLQLWAPDDGRRVGSEHKYDRPILAEMFSPNGKHLLFCTGNRTILLSTETGAVINQWEHGHAVHDLAAHKFSPDGRHLVFGIGRDALLVDTATGAVMHRWTHDHQVSSLAFGQDNVSVFIGTDVSAEGKGETTAASLRTNVQIGGVLQRWSVISGEKLGSSSWVSRGIVGLHPNPDGVTVASVEKSGDIRFWDIARQQQFDVIRDGATVIYNRTGSCAAVRLRTRDKEERVQLYDIVNRKRNGEPFLISSAGSVQFSADGEVLHTIENGAFVTRNAEDGIISARLKTDAAVKEIHFSPNGERAWIRQEGSNVCQLLVPSTGEILWPESEVRFVSFSANGLRAAVGTDLGIQLWDTEEGVDLGLIPGVWGWHDADLSPNGSRVLTKEFRNRDAPVRGALYALNPGPFTGEVRTENIQPVSERGKKSDAAAAEKNHSEGLSPEVGMHPAEKAVWRATSLDGKFVATIVNVEGKDLSALHLRGTEAGSEDLHPLVFENKRYSEAVISRDGVLLAMIGGDVRVVEVATRKVLCTITDDPHYIVEARFSDDHQWLVTSTDGRESDPNRVQMWNARTGQPRWEPIHHEKAATAGYLGNCDRIFTAHSSPMNEGTMQIFDAATGVQIGPEMHLPAGEEFGPPAIHDAAGLELRQSSSGEDTKSLSRFWRIRAKKRLDGKLAVRIVEVAGGVSIEASTGATRRLSQDERLRQLPLLMQDLAGNGDWKEALEATLPWETKPNGVGGK